jgi:hypothetical protein
VTAASWLKPIDLAPLDTRGAGEDAVVVASGPHVGHRVARLDEVLEEASYANQRGLVAATCSCGAGLELRIDARPRAAA